MDEVHAVRFTSRIEEFSKLTHVLPGQELVDRAFKALRAVRTVRTESCVTRALPRVYNKKQGLLVEGATLRLERPMQSFVEAVKHILCAHGELVAGGCELSLRDVVLQRRCDSRLPNGKTELNHR